tara:strand:- start:566 stop:970 length:405 start_codon:yes stop_codon:yes gene_type:complete
MDFYTYNNIRYHLTFSPKWAMCHIPSTGPRECFNCITYGMKNNVFYGYCLNCATVIYNLQRGYGFDSKNSNLFFEKDKEIENLYTGFIDEHNINDLEESEDNSSDCQSIVSSICSIEDEYYQENPYFKDGYDSY